MKIRPISPWLIAALSCFLLIVFLRGALAVLPKSATLHSGTVEGSLLLAGKEQTVSLPGSSNVSSKLVALLSFVPDGGKKAVPLVAAMIENHEDARAYQQGLKEALIVFELIAEGDITRFLAVFRADKLPKLIGPVRSLREHFVSIALGYKPLLLHIGGHPLAYEALENNPALLHHDGIRYDGQTYHRDTEASAPHNLFMSKEPLQELLKKTKLALFSLPLFAIGSLPSTEGEKAQTIEMNMGSPLHDVTYNYRSLQNGYIRSIEGSSRQAQPSTIAILEATVDGFNQAGYIPWTNTTAGGKMLLFRNGKVFKGTWKREKGKPFVFLDSKGEILPVTRGQVWVTMLPALNMVTWE